MNLRPGQLIVEKWDDVALTADGISGDVALSSFGFICEWSE